MARSLFYGPQAEQFCFYQVPKLFFTDEELSKLSPEAKLLYAALLDRMSLSAKNGWILDGAVYIYYTVTAIQDLLSCGKNKAVTLLQELESADLISRKHQGLGKPDRIFVKNFATNRDGSIQRFADPNPQKFENQTSGGFVLGSLESPKSNPSNTDKNHTEKSDTDLSIPSGAKEGKRGYVHQDMIAFFRERLDIAVILESTPEDAETVEELLCLIADTFCSSQARIRIGRDDKPIEVVRGQFMKLDSEHIRFVVKCMKENTTKVRSIRQYLLASLFYAPMTISNYYTNLVSHDLARDAMGTGPPFVPGSPP